MGWLWTCGRMHTQFPLSGPVGRVVASARPVANAGEVVNWVRPGGDRSGGLAAPKLTVRVPCKYGLGRYVQ